MHSWGNCGREWPPAPPTPVQTLSGEGTRTRHCPQGPLASDLGPLSGVGCGASAPPVGRPSGSSGGGLADRTFKGQGASSKSPHMANVPRSARRLTPRSPASGRRHLCSSRANREAAGKCDDAFVKGQPYAELPDRADHG